MTYLDMLVLVQTELKGFHIPEGRAHVHAHVGVRVRNGKRERTVGYSWRRMYSHHMTGRVYDCVLGYGPTVADAIAMMRSKATARDGDVERAQARGDV